MPNGGVGGTCHGQHTKKSDYGCQCASLERLEHGKLIVASLYGPGPPAVLLDVAIHLEEVVR